MFPFLRRVTPLQWVRIIQAYLLLGAFGVVGVSIWILWPTTPALQQDAKVLDSDKNLNTAGRIRFPPVPPPEMAKYLQKRRRRVEMPSEAVAPTVTPLADQSISQQIPEFEGELIATFVEQESDSRAVFRIGGLPKMLAIGETITQAGIEFRLMSVERKEVELATAGQRFKIRMRD